MFEAILIFLILGSKSLVMSATPVPAAFTLNYLAVVVTNYRLISSIPRRSVMLILIALLFVIGGQFQAAVSVIMLLGVARAYAHFVCGTSPNIQKFVLFMPICILFLFNSEQFMNLDFISTYGRGQILFGIFHPKEQAILINFLFVTYILIIKARKPSMLEIFCVLILLYITDSRIQLLSFMLLISVLYLGFKSISITFILSTMFLPLLMIYMHQNWDAFNYLSSFRLELWAELFAAGYSNEGSSIDSSWLEFGRYNALVIFLFIIIFIPWIVYYTFHLWFAPDRNVKGGLFLFFLLSNSTDLGAFSATNLMSIVFWASYLYPKTLFSRKSLIEKL